MAIVVIGAVFVDVKGFPEDLYLPTGRNAGEIKFVHGGVGRNVAEDIANVELRPVFVSLVDKSAQGEEVVRQLRRHKVNTDYIRAVPNGMGMWLAVFDQYGDLAGSISQRPDLSRICDILDQKGDEIFKNADSVVIEADIGKDIVKRALDLAEKYGKPVYGVVANMGIASERRDFLQRMDCFVCNQAEAGILFVADYANITPGTFPPSSSPWAAAARCTRTETERWVSSRRSMSRCATRPARATPSAPGLRSV